MRGILLTIPTSRYGYRQSAEHPWYTRGCHLTMCLTLTVCERQP